MAKHIEQFNSESWRTLNWKKIQRQVFRLQRKIYKAIREGDVAKAKCFQKLLMRSYSAKLLSIRQVTQLNAGKKTAGIDRQESSKFQGKI